MVMVCCMRLMCCLSVICFCPTDEQTFFLYYDRGEPEFLLWIIICEYHLLYAGLRLLHLKSYTACMYYVFIFIQDIFTAQIFANMFKLNSTQCLTAVVRSQRQLIFIKHTLVCTYSLVLGLSSPCFCSLVHTRLW